MSAGDVGVASDGANAASAFNCDECNCSFRNSNLLERHRNGMRHAKKLKQLDFERKVEEKNPEVYCKECQLIMRPELMASHLKGMKHAKRAKDLETANCGDGGVDSCEICQVKLSPRIRDSHFKGLRHLKALKAAGDQRAAEQLKERKLRQAGNQDGATNADASANASTSSNAIEVLKKLGRDKIVDLLGKRYEMKCSVCEIKFSTFSQAEHHYNSKAHRTAYVKRQKEHILSKGMECKQCKVIVSSQVLYNEHINGYKHELRVNNGVIPITSRHYDKYSKLMDSHKFRGRSK